MDTTGTDSDSSPGGEAPTFSVVIPTHHRPQLVTEAVASVVAQTRRDWECVVVDDGGHEPLDFDDPRVTVIRRDTSGGPAAARNTGVAAARGRYLVFLDDDDRFTPDRLELAVAGLEAADISLCWTRWFDPTDGPGHGERSARAGRRLSGDVSDHILDATTPHLGATAVRAESVLAFDESYRCVEDVEWWLRMAAHATVVTVERVGCELRRHEGERANGTDVTARLRQSERLLDEHAEYFRHHPRARAFRWARMGVMAGGLGATQTARQWYLRSLRARPNTLALRGLGRTIGKASRPLDPSAASRPSGAP